MNDNLKNWIPIRVYRNGSGLSVDWCYAGSTRFTQPFFRDSVQQILRSPFSLLFRRQTSIDVLKESVSDSRSLYPTGFIFHMSRCGSTLVSQMLAALPCNIVISEAAPIDSVLRQGGDAAVTIPLLRSVVGAFGQKRIEGERHYFIKFDSWNTLDLGLIHSAFPDVPWIFLYREPVEVIVSQMQKRGSQMIPGSVERIIPGVGLPEALTMSAEEYCARTLASFCEAAIKHADNANGMLVNYNELPEAALTRVLEHFRVSFDDDELQRMRSVAQFNAKTPQLVFEPDIESKRASATDAIREAAARWVDPLYKQLESMRLERKK